MDQGEKERRQKFFGSLRKVNQTAPVFRQRYRILSFRNSILRFESSGRFVPAIRPDCPRVVDFPRLGSVNFGSAAWRLHAATSSTSLSATCSHTAQCDEGSSGIARAFTGASKSRSRSSVVKACWPNRCGTSHRPVDRAQLCDRWVPENFELSIGHAAYWFCWASQVTKGKPTARPVSIVVQSNDSTRSRFKFGILLLRS